MFEKKTILMCGALPLTLSEETGVAKNYSYAQVETRDTVSYFGSMGIRGSGISAVSVCQIYNIGELGSGDLSVKSFLVLQLFWLKSHHAWISMCSSPYVKDKTPAEFRCLCYGLSQRSPPKSWKLHPKGHQNARKM